VYAVSQSSQHISGAEVENSSHSIAGPTEQESGADWRAVELHSLKSSAFEGACRGRVVSFSYFVVRSSEPKDYCEEAAQHA
jgi:hypothetical protein